MTLPLVITVAPRPGESLTSVLARVCHANAVERQSDLLELIELRTLRPEYIAFSKIEFADSIADLFSVDRTDLYSRFHSALPAPGTVEWYGTRLPRRFIGTRARRYSPASLRRSGHHREEWNVRALPYCPESFELLRSDCPYCGLRLSWRRTKGITVCEACGRSLKRAAVDLVPLSDRPDAGTVAGLISPDPSKRARSMARLPSIFLGWEPGDVFVAAVLMASIFDEPKRNKKLARGERWHGNFSTFTTDDLLAGFRRVREWPRCISTAVDQHIRTASKQSLRAPPVLRRLSLQTKCAAQIVKLIRDEIATQMLAHGIPLGISGRAAKKFCSDAVVSSQEAVSQHRISYKTLAKLPVSAESICIRAERPGKYGLKLFDDEKLARAVHVRRAALTETDVCSRLDVLPVALDHLVRLNLLVPITDQGAATMASCRLYEAVPVKELADRLNTVKPSTEIRTRAVDLLRRQFHPLAQSQAILGVLDGRLATVGRDARGRLQVDEADATEFAVAQRPSSVPQGEVTFLAAARLLGLHGPFVGIAYKMGLLKGKKLAANLANIPLSSVASFDQAYASSGEVSGLLGVRPTAVAKLMRQVGAKPAARIMGKAVWRRQEAERLWARKSMGRLE